MSDPYSNDPADTPTEDPNSPEPYILPDGSPAKHAPGEPESDGDRHDGKVR